jgi:hypothetical protein
LVPFRHDRVVEPVSTTSARRAALTRLIDHAALFPPALLSMPEALAEDRRVRAEPTGWLVNRFVVPASRLADLPGADLPLSVVLDRRVGLDDSRIEAVEVPGDPDGLEVSRAEVYVELPTEADVAAWIPDLAARGLRAKLRCGGASVPTVARVAAFVRACRDHRVAFKATAGLHHPVRRDGGHGFLNLLAAAALGDEEAILEDADATSFSLDDEALRWRDRAVSAAAIARVRRDLFVSFGSCSVQEPVDDLTALGILP